jgi:hypothetical protein
MGVVDVG